MSRPLAPLALLLLAACDGSFSAPGAELPAPGLPAPEVAAAPGAPGQSAPSAPPLPSVALCGSQPGGRAFIGLGGEHLEVGRKDQAAFTDFHRPYRNLLLNGSWTVTRDVAASIGAASGIGSTLPEHRAPGTGGSFGVVPANWYDESTVGPFAIYVTFNFAFKVCLASFAAPSGANRAGWYEHVTFAPTPERATAFCTRTMQNAWSRAPTTEEVSSCVDLALDLEEEPTPQRRWAYVCASIVSSTNWLAY